MSNQEHIKKIFYNFYLFQENDPVASVLRDSSEEGQKVVRNKGDQFLAVFKRIEDNYDQCPS